MAQFNWRTISSFSVLSVFVVFVLFSGIGSEIYGRVSDALSGGHKVPDFGQFTQVKTLDAHALSLDKPGHRAVFVGDVHGMSQSLEALLDEISFNPKKDKLIHCGDICTKGPFDGSLAVLEYMSSNNVSGVRGNHDQVVIEWRAWMEWIRGLYRGQGRDWLEMLHARWDEAVRRRKEGGARDDDEEDELDGRKWMKKQRKMAKRWEKKFWKKVPEDWEMFGEDYQLARKLTKADYDYLVSLPLVLHIPSEHTFVVHAGILPYDPTRPITSERQPLAHPPFIGSVYSSPRSSGVFSSTKEKHSLPLLREAQEISILQDIKKNRDPWVLQNMRSVLKDGEITKESNDGTPWTELWNSVMPRCSGYDDLELSKNRDKTLPCQPSTVVYGHAASRDLDLNRWTKGLDTGCVYGRRMTALILDAPHKHRSRSTEGHDDEYEDIEREVFHFDDPATTSMKTAFGDNGRAHIVSVSCHKHREQKPHNGKDKSL